MGNPPASPACGGVPGLGTGLWWVTTRPPGPSRSAWRAASALRCQAALLRSFCVLLPLKQTWLGLHKRSEIVLDDRRRPQRHVRPATQGPEAWERHPERETVARGRMKAGGAACHDSALASGHASMASWAALTRPVTARFMTSTRRPSGCGHGPSMRTRPRPGESLAGSAGRSGAAHDRVTRAAARQQARRGQAQSSHKAAPARTRQLAAPDGEASCARCGAAHGGQGR